MADNARRNLITRLRQTVHPVIGAVRDYDPLMDLVGDARFVLLGEASHGTHEFYKERAEITKRLVKDKGFTAVAVEADWPDAYRVNRYVRGISRDRNSERALGDFKRFPSWMWRNIDVLEFVDWLHKYNDTLPTDNKVGFYGLDLYSLYASIEAVIGYLDKVDPAAARRARRRYSCFERFDTNVEAYGLATEAGIAETCEDEVVKQLTELQRRADEYARRDGRLAQDELFYAEQNARLVKDAEAYYRTMFRFGAESWNLRDRHMVETLDALAQHLDKKGSPAKIVVWEHNSHVGDARATEMSAAGELNVGQLVRERYGDKVVLVGFTTYSGTVTAASEWGGPAERMRVRPGLRGSYEKLFHGTGIPRFLMTLRGDEAVTSLLSPRLERAIGVVYVPATERASHYFYARLPEQFDAVLHFDETRAVEPLERTAKWEEVPEAFPTGL